jgi:hypothetical protein
MPAKAAHQSKRAKQRDSSSATATASRRSAYARVSASFSSTGEPTCSSRSRFRRQPHPAHLPPQLRLPHRRTADRPHPPLLRTNHRHATHMKGRRPYIKQRPRPPCRRRTSSQGRARSACSRRLGPIVVAYMSNKDDLERPRSVSVKSSDAPELRRERRGR